MNTKKGSTPEGMTSGEAEAPDYGLDPSDLQADLVEDLPDVSALLVDEPDAPTAQILRGRW